jgi:1-acyl-sn-glycerol-3-phosphate acyltransferase
MKQSIAAQSTADDTPLLMHFPPLWRNRNFFLLATAYVVSVVGDRIHYLVMLALMCYVILHDKTESAQHSAQLNIAMFIPFLMLAPIGGAISDRLPRRWVMIGCDLTRFVIVIIARTVLLVAAYHSSLPVWELLVLLFGSEVILSSFGEIFSPARAAIVPNLVHPRELLQANSILSVAGTISTLAGFVLGGVLITLGHYWHYGLQVAMYADAATYLMSATAVFSMKLQPGMDRPEPVKGHTHPGLIKELTSAWHYLRCHKHPLQAITLEVLFFTASSVILNCMPAIVTSRFHLTASDFAYFMGVAGIGMIVGAAAVSRARNGIPKEVGIGWATVAIGAGILMAGQASHWETFLIWLTLSASFGAVMFITVDTLLQRVVPDWVRGRVMGARDMLTTFGLLLPTVPIAFWPKVDAFLMSIILGVGTAILAIGVFLLIIYYRRQPLPLPAAAARRLVAAYMQVVHRWRRANACRIPVHGPAIVVGDHGGALQTLAVAISSKRRLVRLMMEEKYFRLPILRQIFGLLGCISINRQGARGKSLRQALRALNHGHVVGLFPEISTGYGPAGGEPQLAAAMLAARTGAPVVPVYISGTYPHRSVLHDLLKPARVVIHFGSPIHFDRYDKDSSSREHLREVAKEILQAIEHLRLRVESAAEKGSPTHR